MVINRYMIEVLVWTLNLLETIWTSNLIITVQIKWYHVVKLQLKFGNYWSWSYYPMNGLIETSISRKLQISLVSFICFPDSFFICFFISFVIVFLLPLFLVLVLILLFPFSLGHIIFYEVKKPTNMVASYLEMTLANLWEYVFIQFEKRNNIMKLVFCLEKHTKC